jgi:hypothetical protein
MPIEQAGRLLIVGGVLLLAVGLLLLGGARLPLLGRLPGDLHWEHDGVSVYLPLGTSLVVSLVLSVVFSLLSRMTGRGE